MGAYENPQRGIDKQFEVVRKEQQALWGNVQQNLAKIQQQEAKRARQLANKYNTYYSLYDRGMKGIINDSNEILTNSDVSPEEGKALSNQINQPFIDGKNRITSLIKSGATDGEIRAAIDEEISGARSYATSLGLINGLSETWGNSVAKGSESDGKDEGSALITGNNYGNTFDALNGVDVGNLKFVKNGPGTFDYSFWYDKDLNGELDQDTEILNLQSLEGSVVDGKLDIKTMPSDDDLFSKDFLKGVRTALDDDKFQTVYQVVDANGNLTEGKRRNKNSQYNDFMGNSGSGAIVNDFIRDREQVYFQKFFGANALADALEANMTVDEMRYRVKEYMYKNKIEGTLTGAETKVKQGSKARSSIRTYENPVGDNSVREVVKRVNDDITPIYQSFQAGNPSPETEQELTFLLRGSKFRDSAKPAADVIQGNLKQAGQAGQYILDKSNMNIFTVVDDNGAPIGTIDMTDDKNNLVTSISKGHFRKGSKNQQAVDYLVTNGIDAELPDDKSFTVSSPGQQQDIIVNEDDEAASDAPDFSQGQAFESGYQGRKNPWDEQITVMNQSTSVTPSGGTQPQATTIDLPSFGGTSFAMTNTGNIDVSNADPSDNKTIIANVMNFENTSGSKSGGKIDNYGFSGANSYLLDDAFTPELDKVKADNPNIGEDAQKAIAAEQTIEKYIIGIGGKTKLNDKDTTILYDLGINEDEFNNLSPEIRGYLIDYKLNSGRNSKDLMMILQGDWDGNRASKNVGEVRIVNGQEIVVDPKTGQDVTGNPKWTTLEEADEYNNFKFDKSKFANITPRQLELARRQLYLGGDAKISDTPDWKNSQSKRLGGDQVGAINPVSHNINPFPPKDIKSKKELIVWFTKNNVLPGDTINGQTVKNY